MSRSQQRLAYITGPVDAGKTTFNARLCYNEFKAEKEKTYITAFNTYSSGSAKWHVWDLGGETGLFPVLKIGTNPHKIDLFILMPNPEKSVEENIAFFKREQELVEDEAYRNVPLVMIISKQDKSLDADRVAALEKKMHDMFDIEASFKVSAQSGEGFSEYKQFVHNALNYSEASQRRVIAVERRLERRKQEEAAAKAEREARRKAYAEQEAAKRREREELEARRKREQEQKQKQGELAKPEESQEEKDRYFQGFKERMMRDAREKRLAQEATGLGSVRPSVDLWAESDSGVESSDGRRGIVPLEEVEPELANGIDAPLKSKGCWSWLNWCGRKPRHKEEPHVGFAPGQQQKLARRLSISE